MKRLLHPIALLLALPVYLIAGAVNAIGCRHLAECLCRAADQVTDRLS